MRYPDSWTARADALGKLSAKGGVKRGWHQRDGNDSVIALNLKEDRVFDVAVHEYAHRLQAALPELDRLFQDLHRRRTQGDTLKKLRVLKPGWGYDTKEMAREDHYIDAYWGKEYKDGGALEVMSMGFQTVLGNRLTFLKRLSIDDSEMLDFVVGLLHHWKP